MNGSTLLIGGGEIATGQTQLIDLELVRGLPRDATLLFFPTAAGDSAGYVQTIERVFGAHVRVAAALREHGREAVAAEIASAAVIYLGGGSTDLLLGLCSEWDLVPLLRAALARGATLAGMSAGAQALATRYVHEDGPTVELRDGWGIVPCTCLVHATLDSAQRALELCRAADPAATLPLIAIGERAAWHTDTSGVSKAIGDGPLWVARSLDADSLVPDTPATN